MERNDFDAVVVGGGIAGLTAAAYLCKAGLKTALLEKEKWLGGLVRSFERGGFVFDGGIRAIENSGIVLPMLRQLGIAVDFLESGVSIGFARDVVRLSSRNSLEDYRELLCRHFPGNREDIEGIVAEIARIMGYMDVLYGIDNPLFLDLKGDPRYVFRTVLPWLVKYLLTMPKVARLNAPVDEYLATFTSNKALIDMLAQHFFKKTPAFFALSYFSLYLDYRYPKGGTGILAEKLGEYIREHGGAVLKEVTAARVDPGERRVIDLQGREYCYRKLLWAADTRTLYRILDSRSMPSGRVSKGIAARAREVSDKRGGDSVFTLYLALNLEPGYFARIASAHFFYTPVTTGLLATGSPDPQRSGQLGDHARPPGDKQALLAWIKRYLELTTYEISCPALRDPKLAPEGKTGLIVSTLMDHPLVRQIRDQGWYEEFKRYSTACILEVLDRSIFPGLAASVQDAFASTPLTIERITGNSDGAITGWAFTNDHIPAVHELPKVARAVLTPIPDVYQAGQWSFSPSGLPISILTGKLAADRIAKDLKKQSGRRPLANLPDPKRQAPSTSG